MSQNAVLRAGSGQIEAELSTFERPETYVIGSDGRARRMPPRKQQKMPTFRKYNTQVFDQASGRRKGKAGDSSTLQSAGRIPFANIAVAGVAGWQLLKYVRNKFFGKPQQPSEPKYPYGTQLQQQQQQATEMHAVTHALRHVMPVRPNMTTLAQQRAQQHRARARKVAGGQAKASAQAGQGVMQRRQGVLGRWDQAVKQQAQQQQQEPGQQQQQQRRGRRRPAGPSQDGLVQGFLLPGAAAGGVAGQAGGPGQRGVRAAAHVVQHGADVADGGVAGGGDVVVELPEVM